MYVISNQDRDYIIKYLDLMIQHTPKRNLTEINAVRVAGILKKKLETKQPFSLSDLPTELQKFLPRK